MHLPVEKPCRSRELLTWSPKPPITNVHIRVMRMRLTALVETPYAVYINDNRSLKAFGCR